jgi:hypothetical protein
MRDQFKMNVLAVEYPGYGLLKHIASSEKSVQEVVLTVFRFVVDELRVAYEQIFLFGRSIGSGPATYLASTFPVGGLILVAAFASINEVIRSLAGRIIAGAFVERFPNISLIGNVSCPTLFIHGEKDSLVPPEQSVALFKQCRARKLLITPPSLEHNTNLWSDASFLAVPAINFFGLPGYQQEKPVTMPQHVFEDGRRQFLLRKSSRRKGNCDNEDKQLDSGNPWFLFCGCPTNKGRAKPGSTMIGHDPPVDSREHEWTPENGVGPNSLSLLEAQRNNSRNGSPSSAARETQAAKLGRPKSEESNRAAGPSQSQSRLRSTWKVP